MSFVALFESIWNKPKVTKRRKKTQSHKMVNIYVSCFSLAASQFPRRVSKKASHLVKSHSTKWVTGTLAPAYLFIYYLSSLFIYTLFILVRLFQGPLWVPISVWGCSDPCVEEEGWDDPPGWGFWATSLVGCVVVFGKSMEVLQPGAFGSRKEVKACGCAGGAALIVPKGEQ